MIQKDEFVLYWSSDVQDFIQSPALPPADEQRLPALTPSSYIGLAPELVGHIREKATNA